jgi:transposase
MTVIGIDAHKRSHTLVAVDTAGRRLATTTVAATSAGHLTALRWAHSHYGRDIRWGVEDVRAMTARLERDFMDAGQQLVRVPTQMMARQRRTGRERGKSDPIDALAVARAVLANPDLPIARHHRWSRDIKLLADRRHNLLKHHGATTTRLLWRLHELDPTYQVKPGALRWRVNLDAVAAWLHDQPGMLAEMARAEVHDLMAGTPEIQALERQLAKLVRAATPSLMELYGCGDLTAARIIGEVADIARFKNEAAFASYAGLAPVPNWSGSTAGRHRANRGGNRALNAAIHQIAMIQITERGPAGADYQRRRNTETHTKAIKRIKRRIARTIYKRLRADLIDPPIATLLAQNDRRLTDWSALLGHPFAPSRRARRRQPGPPAHTSVLPFVADLDRRAHDWHAALAEVHP